MGIAGPGRKGPGTFQTLQQVGPASSPTESSLMSLHIISWYYLVRASVGFCLLLTLDQYGQQGPETGDVIDVSNLNVVHDEKFVECCVCYVFVALATNVFYDDCGGGFHAGVYKAVDTSMGSR